MVESDKHGSSYGAVDIHRLDIRGSRCSSKNNTRDESIIALFSENTEVNRRRTNDRR